MKKITVYLLAMLIAGVSFAQNFEGKVTYANIYKSKIAGVTDEQFTSMMGDEQEYYIKNADYKILSNGSMFQWMIYVSKENKLYTKLANSPTLLWNDGAINAEEVISSKLNKAVTEILGYQCDELILTCKSGVQKYYFSSKMPVESNLFVNHKYGNWYEFLSRSNAIPLKSIIENEQFITESTATAVSSSTLDKALFNLPPNVETEKNPY